MRNPSLPQKNHIKENMLQRKGVFVELLASLLCLLLFLTLALFLSLLLLFPVLLPLILIVLCIRRTRNTYFRTTKNSWASVCNDKGKLGEYMIYKKLRKFERKGSKFLFNIYIPKGENETTEIDVLMLHRKGIFVFESKNYSGWIYGKEYEKDWYQSLPDGSKGRRRKIPFYNPIMQNQTHIKCLKVLLGEDIPMYSIVVFSERCILKSVRVKDSDALVINRYDVFFAVKSICRHQGDVLNKEQVANLYDKLFPYTQVDTATKTQHIANIQNRLSLESDTQKCPSCGGDLVLRKASRGVNAGNEFWGCSNYPKCRYTKDKKI